MVLMFAGAINACSCSTTAFDCLAFASLAAFDVAPWLMTPTSICTRSGRAETVASPWTRMKGTDGGVTYCCAVAPSIAKQAMRMGFNFVTPISNAILTLERRGGVEKPFEFRYT